MPGLIPQDIIDRILDANDIAEIISGYIPLKRAGRNFKALCPFHHEKTPSFTVSPDRQIYHCFGCGAGGNVFSFLMKYERMEFPEAVEMLAKKVGISIPKTEPADKNAGIAEKLFSINELASKFYHDILFNSKEAGSVRAYLEKRGISSETAKKFRLGFAPDKWDALINYLRQKNFSLSLIDKTGLISSREDSSGYYDRFRDRIIFPIFDIKDRIVGFGARVTNDTLPKYINSPETPIYVKGKNLFGLNFTKDEIRKHDSVVVVEGYLDFIIPYQAGIHNIVASLGTALTIEQIRIIKRYTQNAIILFDPDLAGELATLRSLDLFLSLDMNVRLVSLPKGFDPDSFVRDKGADKLKELIEDAVDLFDYKLDLLKEKYDIIKAQGKAKIAEEMLATISKIKNEVLKESYLKKLSEILSVKEDALLKELSKVKDGISYIDYDSFSSLASKPLNIRVVEKMVVKLMLEHDDLIRQVKEKLDISDFQDPHIKKIVCSMLELNSQGRKIEASRLMNHFDDQAVAQTLTHLCLSEECREIDKQKAFDDCINRIKQENIKEKRNQLHGEIKIAESQGNKDRLNQLMKEYNCLIKK
ncbi:MAG: DNA primase [Candidatus Omnitrophica bacterium]|nr:DNA primase [Candidatus Omnitrophota bacterium]